LRSAARHSACRRSWLGGPSSRRAEAAGPAADGVRGCHSWLGGPSSRQPALAVEGAGSKNRGPQQGGPSSRLLAVADLQANRAASPLLIGRPFTEASRLVWPGWSPRTSPLLFGRWLARDPDAALTAPVRPSPKGRPAAIKLPVSDTPRTGCAGTRFRRSGACAATLSGAVSVLRISQLSDGPARRRHRCRDAALRYRVRWSAS
jgi:hypothetical protein